MYSLQFIILNIIFELMSIVPRVVCTSTVTLPTASFTHLKSSLSSIISSPPSNTFDHQQSTSLNYTTNLSSSKLAIPFPTLVVSSIVVSDYVTVSPNQVYGVNQSLILAMASSQTHTTIQSNFSKHSINSSSNYTVNTTKKVMVPANKSFSSHSSQRMTSSVSNLFSSSFKVTPTSTLVNISKFTSMSQNKSMMLMSTPTILMNTSTTNNRQMSITATNQYSAKSIVVTSTPTILTSTSRPSNYSQMSISVTNNPPTKGGENKLLIIGLAVGLPLGIVLIIVVIVFYRKKRASNQYNIFYDEQNIVMHPFDYSK
ncbi:uncharacterized threonine-rich GPI-anchored glycoprotein PJ4664.02-like isoform X3 [Xenia sp. Carnegie-2017]|uniref:uncharacterized threonine-rich GPI-anchored glycoprotein PJ4664.02-like isoform X3 n=1 Tax=Xenia sp. Carnegie-2017 TaxID=2897299 RepID=UPI001F037E53|nr:uncharacterized threonine-rich GPI-anchored glycoprotein PJ4664.02-like isoform X3 [Xenia sp. Carnegie-2017]